MNAAQRLEAVFAGEMIDCVPFALKGWRIPQCEAERALRNQGMCIFDARSVYRTHSPNVQSETLHFTREGIGYQRTTIKTSKGELSTLNRQVAADQVERTTWQMEWPFKGPEDYAALRAMVSDRRYTPSYEGFLKAREQLGGDAYFKTIAPGCPLHDIMYSFMGLEIFSIEWEERRDEVLALHQAMSENISPLWEIIARSPARVVQSGGNYAPSVLGRERFVEYVMPHWEEAAAPLRQRGKMLGSHLDADNQLWAAEVAAAPLDWIEAFSPTPDTDMSVAQARAAWPGKVLFLNFPSAVHLESPQAIAATTRQLLREAAPGDRFIVGITENVPEDQWRVSFATILQTLNECGRLPIRGEAL